MPGTGTGTALAWLVQELARLMRAPAWLVLVSVWLVQRAVWLVLVSAWLVQRAAWLVQGRVYRGAGSPGQGSQKKKGTLSTLHPPVSEVIGVAELVNKINGPWFSKFTILPPVPPLLPEVIGVAELVNKINGPWFSKFDEDLATAFSIYCGISIAHVSDEKYTKLLSEGIQPVSTIDPNFASFTYTPRSLPEDDTSMAILSMLQDMNFINNYKMDRQTLTRFCLMVKKGYRDPPYHNWMHAFSVSHFCYLLYKNLELVNYLEDIEIFALFISCMCHDLDHRGTNNSFQVASKSVLAALYSSEGSVMERHHFAQAIAILNSQSCNIFDHFSRKDYQRMLDLMRDIILATDLAHHLRIFKDLQKMAEAPASLPACPLTLRCSLADGVVLVDPEYLKERKVFVTLTCAFRYGREDLDVLGLTFRKDLFVANAQAFPPVPEEKKPLTRLQERLIKKLGEHAYPFTFEAALDKEIYYHGEPISVNVHVTNNTNKTVKKIKISVRQYADICLFNTAQYKCPVAVEDADDMVAPSSTFCKVYTLTPFLANNREKRGLALDGKLKHEDTNLASSTLLRDGANKEILGIIVSYKVKVKLVVSRGGLLGDLASSVPENEAPIDTNLIELDTNDDDIVFEDFARQRLKGMKDDKEDEEEQTNSPQLNDR
ncbi:PREDICTED: uncharacterized protein LOC103896987 [Aptenodytes forsteri]|uniref:uncharacterized protein LOC103896987 n=1 Tax=Aptenodytes forsteri TaxID=9233 RepID=UPI0004F426B1|nr:PREDICTED: uncharacterized protein LOC103896987 [Aptenodytes forsteri]